MAHQRPSPLRLTLMVSIVVLALDQVSKAWILTQLTLGESQPILSGIFHLTLVCNPGVAFGLLKNFGWLVVILSWVAVIGLVGWLLRTSKTAPHNRSLTWGAGLILGGALGNLIDRLRFGGVVDFLDFRIWPVFNVADSCITIGVVLIFLSWRQVKH